MSSEPNLNLIRTPADIAWLRQVFPAYLRELAVDQRQTIRATELLDRYWCEENRFPYVIERNAERVGFALVWQDSEKVCNFVSEFSVLPRWRRTGIGKSAALQLFARHPGLWELTVLGTNDVGLSFWRDVVFGVDAHAIVVPAVGTSPTLFRFHCKL